MLAKNIWFPPAIQITGAPAKGIVGPIDFQPESPAVAPVSSIPVSEGTAADLQRSAAARLSTPIVPKHNFTSNVPLSGEERGEILAFLDSRETDPSFFGPQTLVEPTENQLQWLDVAATEIRAWIREQGLLLERDPAAGGLAVYASIGDLQDWLHSKNNPGWQTSAGLYLTEQNAIAVARGETMPGEFLFNIVHELVHSVTYNAWQIEKSPGRTKISLSESGVILEENDQPLFHLLNEALVESLSVTLRQRIFAKYAGIPRNFTEIYTYKPAKEMLYALTELVAEKTGESARDVLARWHRALFTGGAAIRDEIRERLGEETYLQVATTENNQAAAQTARHLKSIKH